MMCQPVPYAVAMITEDDVPAGASKAPVAWLDTDEQQAWRAFLHMHAELTAQLGREMQDEFGLSIADFSVLVQLSEHPDRRLRILELARGLQWEKSRLSHQLTRMEQRGLLERSNCSADRRGAFVVLTDRGLAAVEAAAPRHVAAVRRYVFDGLDATQITALHAIATSVLSRLDTRQVGSDCPAPICDAEPDRS